MSAMGAAHQDTISWLADNWVAIVVVIWVLGGFGWMAERWHRAVEARREAAEIRHRRAVELEIARHGVPYIQPAKITDRDVSGLTARWTEAVKSGRNPVILPAAVIASPPGAQPSAAVPGQCRHERIVPVIDDAGELHRWVCANYPRCEAEFDKSVAIYEPAEES